MNKVFIYIISCGSTLISEDKRKFQKKLHERKVKSNVRRKKNGKLSFKSQTFKFN